MARTPTEVGVQIGNARAMATEVAGTLNDQGYAPEAVADGLLEGAFFALVNDGDAFLTVLARFRHAKGF